VAALGGLLSDVGRRLGLEHQAHSDEAPEVRPRGPGAHAVVAGVRLDGGRDVDQLAALVRVPGQVLSHPPGALVKLSALTAGSDAPVPKGTTYPAHGENRGHVVRVRPRPGYRHHAFR
jgi:hypothetical protein